MLRIDIGGTPKMAGRAYRCQAHPASNGFSVFRKSVDGFAPSSGTVPVFCRVGAEMDGDGAAKDCGVRVRSVLRAGASGELVQPSGTKELLRL